MDTEKLFGRNETGHRKNNKDKIRVAVANTFSALPLIYGLTEKPAGNVFETISTHPTGCGKLLLEGEVDLATIPSFTLARTKETWQLVPDIAVSLNRNSHNGLLFFRQGLQKIDSIAVDPDAEPLVSLMKIMVQERYSITPDFIKMPSDLVKMFKTADAALMSEDATIHEQVLNKNYINLIEDWTDMSGLPFASLVWAGGRI